jgi:hypothetical protein
MGIARGCVSWCSPVVAQSKLVRPSIWRVRAAAAESVMTTVTVDLGDRTYPIYIGSHLTDKPELLTDHIRGKRALVVTNETIAPLYLDKCVLLCASHHQHEACTVLCIRLLYNQRMLRFLCLAFASTGCGCNIQSD